MTKKAKRTLRMAKATSTRRAKPKPRDAGASLRAARAKKSRPNGAYVGTLDERQVTGEQPEKKRRRRQPKEVAQTFTPEQPVELGPQQIPEGKDAEKALKLIADKNDEAIQAHRAYVEIADKAKKAKKRWDDAATEVQRLVQIHTHPSDLPLFADLDQREKDQAAMEDAATTGGEIEV